MDPKCTFFKDGTTVVAGGKMSSALKERLKRCGRSYTSPVCKTPTSHKIPSSFPVAKADSKESSWSLKQNTDLNDSLAECLPLSGEIKNTLIEDNNLASLGAMMTVAEESPVTGNKDETSIDNLGKDTGRTGKSIRHCVATTSPSMCGTSGQPSLLLKRLKNQVLEPLGNSNSNDEIACVKDEKSKLQSSFRDKEEKLRKLNMVKTYRSKNELGQLQRLIDKWRSVAQEAVQELHLLTTDPRPSLTELVDYLHLDHKLIGYSADTESFT